MQQVKTISRNILKDTVLFADLATSTKTSADYTALAVVATDAEANLYILDMVRGRWEWPETRRIFIQTVQTHKLRQVGIESTGFQLAAVQELLREPALLGVTLRPVSPDKDKYTRALPWAARAEAGKVYIMRAPWNPAFLAEVSDFPQGPHDDQVDAVSGAVEMLADRATGWLAQIRTDLALKDAALEELPR